MACFHAREADGYVWVGERSREGSAARGGLHDDGLVSPQIKV